MKNFFMSKEAILRSLAVVLLIVSFITLFSSFIGYYEEEMWASQGTLYSHVGKVELDTEYDYDSYNFFERASYLREEGFGTFLETLSVIFLILSIAVLVLSFFKEFFENFYFAALPLAVAIIFILVASDNNVRYVLDIAYLGQSDGYNVYMEITIKFHMNLVPAIVMSFLATAAVTAAGFIKYQNNKKINGVPQPLAEESIEGMSEETAE